TCNDEAFHGVLLFVDGRDTAADYAGRVRLLKSRKLLAEGFDRPGDEAVERGVLASAIVRVLAMKGGWAMHLLGPVPRYAVRELQRRGVYPPSSPEQTFSGAEFVSIIGRMEDYQRSH